MNKKGQIKKIIAGFFDVISNDGEIFRLRGSGTLRDKNIVPYVGDFVEFRDDKVLTKVLDRKNYLIRPKVANVDQAAIVISLDQPKFSSILLDKFLSVIEFQNIKTIIIFTKADIGDNQPFYDYLSQNFNCILIDNNLDRNSDKWESVRKHFVDKITVFTGQSGVGKTSLLNNILGTNEKTNPISKALNRGKHTTRVVEIFKFDKIKIIDTPGFGQIEINLTKQELSKSYFDFREWSRNCKFSSCLHFKEIDCEIKRKLKDNKLLKSRYENYLKFLNEAKE